MAVMNKMRESMKTILMILVLAFLATIVFDWGMGGFQTPGVPKGIATVNGHDITFEEFNENYQQELKMYRERSGAEPEGYQERQLENQVYERLVQQYLLRDVIDELALNVSSEEIGEELWNNPPEILRNNPAFQDSTGAFSYETYQRALQTPEADEFWNNVIEYLKGSLPYQKLGTLLNASAVVTDDDAWVYYLKNNLKAEANFIFYNASEFIDAVEAPIPEELEAFYKEHKEDYKVNERRVLDYVLLEIKATAADSQAVEEQADDLLQEAKAGEDFAELARLYSQDPGSAEKGGDLGFFTRDAMVKPFADAAFTNSVGSIVGPVVSNFGLHVIKIVDRRVQDGETEVKASHILLKYEPSASTREALFEQIAYIQNQAEEYELDLAEIAEEEKVELQTTQPFEKESGFIPGIGMETSVTRFAFNAKVGETSRVLNTQNGYLVAQLAEIQEEHIQPLEEVQARVESSVKNEKSMAAARTAAQTAFDKLQAGAAIDDVAAQDSLQVQTTGEFTPSAAITGIGREAKVSAAAFALSEGEYSEPVEGKRGFYILQLTAKNDLDKAGFEAQKESIKRQLATQREQQIFGKWYTHLKENADIVDFRDKVLN